MSMSSTEYTDHVIDLMQHPEVLAAIRDVLQECAADKATAVEAAASAPALTVADEQGDDDEDLIAQVQGVAVPTGTLLAAPTGRTWGVAGDGSLTVTDAA
jgi:hypothetical protein